jgi:catechol 2,3-dioxygenase-like lactoylglutathione lyase family enzyme
MGPDEGLSFAQVRFGNGRRLEMIEPSEDAEPGAIQRIVDGSHPGPHHLTFRVPDLAARLRTLEDAGFHPVRASGEPESEEAFLDPEEAMGFVIRLEETRHGTPTPITPVPEGVAVPPARVEHAAHLDWIGQAVASLDDGLRLFAGGLDGTETRRGVSEEPALSAGWVELEWPEEGRIRLYAPESTTSPLMGWLGGWSGRLHHIALSVERPWDVDGAVARGDGMWEVPPERNEGVRLLLRARQATKQEGGSDQQVSEAPVAAPDPVLLP